MDIIFNLTEADIPPLKQLISANFHDRYILLNDEFFNWQYSQNPVNHSSYSFKIVKYKQKVLGYCGIVPVNMAFGKKEVKAGALANLMIDKKFRGLGLGLHLLKEVTNEYPICYVNGYSEELKKVCQKVSGWTEMGDLTRMIGVFEKQKIQILVNSSKPFSLLWVPAKADPNLKVVKKFGKEVDDLWSRVRDRYTITIVRSQQYLNWRYASNPFISYQLVEYIDDTVVRGYCVIRIETCIHHGQKFIIARLIDLISEPKAETQMIAGLLSRLQAQHVDIIDYFSSGTFHQQNLLDLGFHESQDAPYQSVPLLFKPIDSTRKAINWVMHRRDLGNEDTFSSDPNNWYITKGDGDQDRANVAIKE